MTKTILVVDDDADLRQALRDALEDAGFAVVEAADGAQALAVLRSIRPSTSSRLLIGSTRAQALAVLRSIRPCLVIADLVMPVMGGDELHAAMQRDASLAAIPVVILTSVPDSAPVGALTLAKPVDLELLLALVGRFC